MKDGSMADTNERDSEPDTVTNLGSDMRDSLILSTKLIAVLIVVTTLSLGLVACSVFFIYMCFLHPEAATTLLPVLVPGGIAAVVACYGKKFTALLTSRNGRKGIQKDPK